MSKIDLGFCGICGTQIWTLEKGNNVPNEHYCEISIAISNGSIARHGICDKCVNNLTQEKIANLFERIKESWIEALRGSASEKQLSKYQALTVKTWDQSEKNCLEKHDKVMKDEHQDKLRVAKEAQESKKDKPDKKK